MKYSFLLIVIFVHSCSHTKSSKEVIEKNVALLQQVRESDSIEQLKKNLFYSANCTGEHNSIPIVYIDSI